MKINMLLRSAIVVMIALKLVACSMPTVPKFLSFEGSKLNWDVVTIAAASNANRNSAVAVDVVLVLDKRLTDKLQEMTADKWFTEREDLQKTFPNGVKYMSWELVPGQTLRISSDSLERPRVMSAFVFANYLSQGSNRQRIEAFKGELVIRLDEKSFEVISVL